MLKNCTYICLYEFNIYNNCGMYQSSFDRLSVVFISVSECQLATFVSAMGHGADVSSWLLTSDLGVVVREGGEQGRQHPMKCTVHT